MNTIKTLNNSKLELEVAKQRLEVLLTRKSMLYKTFECNTAVGMRDFNNACDMIDYNSGISLNDDITMQYTLIDKLGKIVNLMEATINQLKGVEYELYTLIVVNGVNISKAVEKVAEHNYMEPSNIWKVYYPRIKHYIKDIKRISSSDFPVK